ncbi:MAG TPA: hypothetical protein PLB18_22980 [Acidobacteriota bacterium]|nr:hypothetical protein [Acidobacteriota bacterium]HNG95462.1 hypothetical protein [Acidobacteriota bacterium]
MNHINLLHHKPAGLKEKGWKLAALSRQRFPVNKNQNFKPNPGLDLDRLDTLAVSQRPHTKRKVKISHWLTKTPLGEPGLTKHFTCQESSYTDSSVRNPEYITGFEAQKKDIYS